MKTYRKVLLFLKKKYPSKTVSIRRTDISPKLHGICEQKTKSSFTIKIDKNLPEDYAIDVLLHEFAHVISWGKDEDAHGINWGIAYSKIYRTYLEEFFSKE